MFRIACIFFLFTLFILGCQDAYISIEYHVSKGNRSAAIDVSSWYHNEVGGKNQLHMNDAVIEVVDNKVHVIHRTASVSIPVSEKPIHILSIEPIHFVDVDAPFFGAAKRTQTDRVRNYIIKIIY